MFGRNKTTNITTMTEARLVKIETTLDFIKDGMCKNDSQHEMILTELKDFKDICDDKYANKAAELLSKENERRLNSLDVRMAVVAGGAVVAFFVIQIILKHYSLI